MGDWKQVGENLVLHRGGTYYLRARVGGKIVRVSLETKKLRIAKLKRDAKLDALRVAATRRQSSKVEIRTLGDLIEALERQANAPHLKATTATDYKNCAKMLRVSLPVTLALKAWSSVQAEAWWKKTAARYSPLKANTLLRHLRRAFKDAVADGVVIDDPTARIRPLRVVQTHRELPTRQQIERILVDVKGQRKRLSEEAARALAWHAFTGMRPAERRAVRWEHVGTDWITVTGGIEGTKNRQVRQIPISPPLRALLDEMRPEKASGLVFRLSSPRFALTNACKRLNLPHLRVYDLRHWFATWAIEQGVDVKTLAGWLGHQDGGALLLKTYSHLQDAHSLEQAQRLR